MAARFQINQVYCVILFIIAYYLTGYQSLTIIFFASYDQGPDNHCCGEVVMKSDGKTKEKHLSRLGKFVKSGGATDNRYSYRQQNGDSYLYWQNGVWMVK